MLRPVNVPNWLDQALGLLAYVYLGAGVLFAATGTAFVVCRYDPFVEFFRGNGFVRGSGSANMLTLGGCFLVAGIFIGRPYCRYLCPYGVILGLVSKVLKWHAKIPPDNCIQCRLCEEACPYGAIREPTVALPASQRPRARRHLAVLLVLCPVLVAAGFWLGRQLEAPWHGCTRRSGWPIASIWNRRAESRARSTRATPSATRAERPTTSTARQVC